MASKKTATKMPAPAPKKAAAPKPVAKKAAKKAAVEKVPAKKATKKVAVAKTRAPIPAKKVAVKPSLDAVARAAYLNYRRRVEQGMPGDSQGDWLEAERQFASMS
jgi:hypothetical protein